MGSEGPPSIEVTLSELLKLCERTLSALRTEKGDRVRIRRDFYWHIPAETKYFVYSEPGELTIGQLSDDLERTRGLLYSETAGVPIEALGWLGRILEAVEAEIAP